MIELSKCGSRCRQPATSRLLLSQAVSVDNYLISFVIAGFIVHGHESHGAIHVLHATS